MISSLLNIAYLLPIPIRGFFSKPVSGKTYTEIKEAPTMVLVAMIITSGTCVILFFYPDPFYQLAILAAGGS